MPSWTTPKTWSTGEVVTAAQLNEQIKDNENYLKDTLPYAISHAEPTRVLDTKYQNDSGKIRAVTVTLTASNATMNVQVKCDANATPTTIVAIFKDDSAEIINRAVTFFVPPDYYYWLDAQTGNNATLAEWHEWDLH